MRTWIVRAMGHDHVVAVSGRGLVRIAHALGVAFVAIVDCDGTVRNVRAVGCALL